MASEKNIDVWFAEQDAAVNEAFQTLRKNRRRRKIDQDEVQRRVDERVAREQEQCALELAITRAFHKKHGAADADEPLSNFRPELLVAYSRMFPGKTLDNHVLRGVRASFLASAHADSVRCEVVQEMQDENDRLEAKRLRSLRKEKKG